MKKGRSRPSERPKKRSGRNAHFGDSSVKAWETRDDIPLDDEEQFHKNRDKLLLNGEESGGSEGEGWDGDEEEVFKLEGIAQDSDDTDGDDGRLDLSSEGDDHYPSATPPTTKIKPSKKIQNQGSGLTGDSGSSSDDSELDLERWGSKKSAYYSTNAAELSSDDEEGNELEEREVLRLQSKARADISEDDYGINGKWEDDGEDGIEQSVDPLRALPPAPLPAQDKASLLRALEINSPETIALARDWVDIAHDLSKVETALKKISPNHPSIGLMHLHHQTLLTYATVLAFYLHLRSDPKYASRPALLTSHPIMSRLLILKQGLSELEGLGLSADDNTDGDDGSDDLPSDEEAQLLFNNLGRLTKMPAKEIQDLLSDLAAQGKANQNETQDGLSPTSKKPKIAKSKVRKDKTTPEQVFDLVEPKFVPSSSSLVPLDDSSGDYGYGDPISLQHSDIKDKDARKKSIRFHTSRIESAGQRRVKARASIGGDDDVPYRERRRDKEIKATKSRNLGLGGEDLEEPKVVGDGNAAKRRRVDADDEDHAEAGASGYYELVKRQRKEQREQKKELYEAERESKRVDYDHTAEDGPRSLTRAILNNRGLTPHRNKAARNPRVKKRQQFEKAKQKLSSKKAIYRGGLASTGGRYDGEKSGIAARVVKSVKLS